MPHRKFILAITIILLISGCAPFTEQEPDPATPIPPNLEQYFESQNFVQGIVQPGRIADLSFSTPGQIEDIRVRAGDAVSEGEVLARLNTEQLELRVRAANIELAVAEANQDRVLAGTHPALITEAQSKVDALKADPALTIPAAQVKEAEINAAQARLDFLQAQPLPEEVEIAAAEVEKARIAVDTAKYNLSLTNLRAPYKGTIIAIYKQPYEQVADGEAVIQIGDNQSTTIRTEMNDIETAVLSPGSTLSITFPALPDFEVSGTVASIQPKWDAPKESRFTVIITLDENPEQVRWGMTANVRLP